MVVVSRVGIARKLVYLPPPPSGLTLWLVSLAGRRFSFSISIGIGIGIGIGFESGSGLVSRARQTRGCLRSGVKVVWRSFACNSLMSEPTLKSPNCSSPSNARSSLTNEKSPRCKLGTVTRALHIKLSLTIGRETARRTNTGRTRLVASVKLLLSRSLSLSLGSMIRSCDHNGH